MSRQTACTRRPLASTVLLTILTSIGELSTGARSERRTCAGSHSREGASSQVALVSSMDPILEIACQAVSPSYQRTCASSGIEMTRSKRRTYGCPSAALSTTAVTFWPETRSTISTTSPAAGAAGVMGFSLTGDVSALAGGS